MGPTEAEFREGADLQEGISGQAEIVAGGENYHLTEVRMPRSAMSQTVLGMPIEHSGQGNPSPDEPPDGFYGPHDYD